MAGVQQYMYSNMQASFIYFIFKEFETKKDTVYENVTGVLKSGLKELSKCIQDLKEKNATLKAELLEKDGQIEILKQVKYHL